jgi:hypothetical protein
MREADLGGKKTLVATNPVQRQLVYDLQFRDYEVNNILLFLSLKLLAFQFS